MKTKLMHHQLRSLKNLAACVARRPRPLLVYPHRLFAAPPPKTATSPTPPVSSVGGGNNAKGQANSGGWSDDPVRDPLAGMSEEEIAEIKRGIWREGRRVYSIGFSIIGGGVMAVLLAVFLNKK